MAGRGRGRGDGGVATVGGDDSSGGGSEFGKCFLELNSLYSISRVVQCRKRERGRMDRDKYRMCMKSISFGLLISCCSLLLSGLLRQIS